MRPDPDRGAARAVNRRPTMRDVAGVAGVSLATVSRVVNQQGEVRPRLVGRVERAVEALGYRRDLTATNLRRADRLSGSIGFIQDLSNPFHAAVHRGIEEVARARGVLTFAASSDEDAEREMELAQAFLARRLDGLIVVPTAGDHSYLARDRDAGAALVFVDRPATSLDADCVTSDNAGGARDAVSHLIAHGHRRIAFLGDLRQIYTAQERLAGYRAALRAGGIAFDDALVRHDLPDASLARAATLDLLSQPDPPTALFTSQNLITVGAVRALHERGVRHTVAIVGFDDVMLADMLDPGLTVISQDAVLLGRVAAQLLFARIDGDGGATKRIELPTALIRRGSGEIRAEAAGVRQRA